MTECIIMDIDTDKLSKLEREQKMIDRAPFRNLRIRDAKILNTIGGRKRCELCYKSRKFFCYTCCLPVIDRSYFPRVKLPVKIDIIKHAREIDGKSTAIHAAILAPEDVKIYIYPDIPEILTKEETVLIFPSRSVKTVSVEALFTKEGKYDTSAKWTETIFPIKRAVFIDSTWQQTKAIYKDQRLRELRCVILKSRISQFWRHQKKSPRWYLATIEAIHQFLVELHTCAFGTVEGYADLNNSMLNGERNSIINNEEMEEYLGMTERYNGQYDNLLYFFKYMYDKIHSIYDHDKLQAYKRSLT